MALASVSRGATLGEFTTTDRIDPAYRRPIGSKTAFSARADEIWATALLLDGAPDTSVGVRILEVGGRSPALVGERTLSGAEGSRHVAFNVRDGLEPGRYRAVFLLDGREAGTADFEVRPAPPGLFAAAGSGPAVEADSTPNRVFAVPSLPVTFPYPAAWSPPRSDGSTHRIQGPAGSSGQSLEITIHPEMKSDHPGSSAWRQVIRAQDLLTRQNGIMLSMDSTLLDGHPAPYVLVGFPMGTGTFNVLQFVIDHGPHYLWICFSGPSDAWEQATPVLAAIRDSIRFVSEAKR